MQLVAVGAQDKYLTGSKDSPPQITFFKTMQKKHTNFAMESIEQTFNGSVATNRLTSTISRNGDLITNMWLRIKKSSTTSIKDVYDCIDSVRLEIGGTQIDKQLGPWMRTWHDLSISSDKWSSLERMTKAVDDEWMYVPLPFWFCKEPGQALPLIALQYHEVKLTIDTIGLGTSDQVGLWVDYIYLDTEERQRFAREPHEYLIEQVQDSGKEELNMSIGSTTRIRINFNHPVKELVWVVLGPNVDNSAKTGHEQRFDNINKAKLLLNGHDRFTERDGKYFTEVQRYQHHTRGALSNTTQSIAPDQAIYVY